MEISNELISAILQVVLFTLIPFVFFLFRKDKSVSFFRYIGLYGAPPRALVWAALSSIVFIAGTVLVLYVNDDVKAIMMNPPSVTGKIRAMGFNATSVIILLIIALIKTSLAEEILFRGLIAKRCIAWLGFTNGNLVQSLIFALLHLGLFWLVSPSWIARGFIFALSGIGAYLIAILNEKHAGGSIIPGWVGHGLGNVLSYSIVGFVL